MMRLSAVLAILVLFASLAAAAPWYQGQYNSVAGTWQTWGPISMVGVIVAFLVVAVAYMFAVGFDMPELKMWAKSEFYQALASAVLVAGLASMTFLMLDQGMAKIIGTSIDPFNIAHFYLSDMEAMLHSKYQWAYWSNYMAEGATTLSLYQNAESYELYFLAFLKPLIIEPLHLAGYYIIQFLVIISMWKGILIFFKETAFAAFLPLGVFLRIFPPTRGAGGLLIAIAIGFFIVFPTMFAFIAMMSEGDILTGLEGGGPNIGVDLADFNACEHDVEGVAQSAEANTDPAVLSAINTYFSFLPVLWVKVLFYPIVVMAVTVTFIKVLAPLLGSDVSEIGQGLIKLI